MVIPAVISINTRTSPVRAPRFLECIEISFFIKILCIPTCLDNNLCTVDACDPLTGSCVFPPITCPAGQSCNPANGVCGGSDPCAGVVCEGLRGGCAVNSCVAGI
jgi:hypothetical protein